MNWMKPSRKPRAYEVVSCLTKDGREFSGLCWSTERGAFIEPISNRKAEEVVGPIAGWRYETPEASPETPEASTETPSP